MKDNHNPYEECAGCTETENTSCGVKTVGYCTCLYEKTGGKLQLKEPFNGLEEKVTRANKLEVYNLYKKQTVALELLNGLQKQVQDAVEQLPVNKKRDEILN